MKSGVVMSIHKHHAIVVTADGQFLRAPIQGKPQIGEEITFEEEQRKVYSFKTPYWYVGAAAIVLILFLPILLFVQQADHSVVAYLSMDINPSIEIGVDDKEKVRELRALNDDGEQIIKDLKFKGVNVESIVGTILERAKVSHYLDTPNKDIFITSIMMGNSTGLNLDYESILAGKVDQTLRNLLDQLDGEAASAQVTTMAVPNEVREEADVNGISSGKMVVYLMAKDEGYEINLEQLKGQSIDKATDSIGGVKTIVEKATNLSKEKLKALVVKEKEEKAKAQQQKKDDEKSNAVKPSATPVTTPTANKPVKPIKPTSNGSVKVDKPKVNKPATSPVATNKPQTTSKPKDDKNDNKWKDKYNKWDEKGHWKVDDDDDDKDDEKRDKWDKDRQNNKNDNDNKGVNSKGNKEDSGKKDQGNKGWSNKKNGNYDYSPYHWSNGYWYKWK